MEFLAESIGLLDMDNGGEVVYSSSSPAPPPLRPQPEKNETLAESNTSTTATNAVAAAITQSFLYFTWGESSETNFLEGYLNDVADDDDDDDGDDVDDDDDYVSNNNNTPEQEPQQLEQEDEEELGASSLSTPTMLLPTHLPATTSIMPAMADNVLTKHVTQRIDARTNYDCFTGIVDAVTGHLIHGTMLYRQTGDVYEGPFITKYATAANGINSNSSLRHGIRAKCQYSNGMQFAGSFEYDRPQAGTWIGGDDDWTYEGPLVVMVEEKSEKDHEQRNNAKYHGTFQASSNIPSSPPSSPGSIILCNANNNLTSNPLKVIGIPHPLPGSVLFQGNGRFTRPDGFLYHGEFHRGLANGVGKETLPNGKGVYHGEFCDGLRHGVGTLMEDYEEEEESGGGWEDRDCQCEKEEEKDGDGCCLHGRQGQVLLGKEFLSRLDDTEKNASASTGSNDDTTSSADNDVDGSTDDGPDFAAGGTKLSCTTFTQNVACAAGDELASPLPSISSNPCNNAADAADTTAIIASVAVSTPFQSPQPKTVPISTTTQQCKTCHCRHQQQTKRKKQRYSSGVWCAGQYEIEDCRGTVHPDSNEFTEESRDVVAAAATIATLGATSSDNGNDGSSSCSSMVVSLNRTTWDMLDEKWLGI